MIWLRARIFTAGLFSLGAILPFLGLAVIGLAGALLVVLPVPQLRWLAVLAGLFLLANALYGFRIALKTFPRPPGRPLRRGEAPGLEERLEAARTAWQAPAGPALILAPDAWSVELTGVPAAGLFGWNRYHWYLGIYPMLALSLREFDALAAWEAVFWSDFQGWSNLQCKRLAAYWYRVHLHLEAMAREHQGLFPWRRCCWLALRPYCRWVVLRFQPFLAREFVRTDRAVAERHGTPTLVRALCRLAILQPLVSRRVFAQWDARIGDGEPLPADLYQAIAEVLAQPADGLGELLLALALDGLQRESPPLLRLRLEYLEAQPAVPLPPSVPAYQHLLAGTAVMAEIHGLWMDRMRENMIELQQRRQRERSRYRELSASMPGRFPDHPDAGEYLALAFEHAPWDEFDRILGAFRDAHPGSVEGTFLAIRRALQRGRDHGAVQEARALLQRDPLLAPACHEVLAHHLGGRGDRANADKEWDRALRAGAMVEGARRERLGASLVDALQPHGCGWDDLQRIQRLCQDDPRIREAHLVRKRVNHHSDHPVLLLVVRWRGPRWDPFGRARLAYQRELQERCPFPLEATGFVQVLDKAALWRFGPKLRELDCLVFSR